MSRLLEILSTRSAMTFSEYDKAFDFLYGKIIAEKDASNARSLIARLLEELGHCEFDYAKRKVFCCRPNLILLPQAGILSAVLTGARIPEVITKLKRFQGQYSDRMEVTERKQTRDGIPLPDVVTISTSEKGLLLALARHLQIGNQCETPAAWSLLNASADIYEYERTLLFQVSFAQGWRCRLFSTDELHFKRVTFNSDLRGLLEFTHPVTEQKTYIWHQDQSTVEVDKDWGRYLAIKYANSNIIVYDKNKQLLGLPSFVPLPRLFARAITLCSGVAAARLPLAKALGAIPANTVLDVYHGVPENIATLLSKKLGQELVLNIFTMSEEGELA